MPGDNDSVLPDIALPNKQHFQINEILSNTTKKKSAKANHFLLSSTPEETQSLAEQDFTVYRKLLPPNTAAADNH